MIASMESIDAKLNEVINRLEHVETLLCVGEEHPDNEDIDSINGYYQRKNRGKIDFIALEDIDDEL